MLDQKGHAPEKIILGRIGAPFGVRGWVHVHSFTEPEENILNYSHWHLNLRGQWRAVEVLEIRPHGKHFIALLAGYEEREKVATLTQTEFGVPRSELPALEPGEYYWADLIGLKVVTETGVALGTISQVFETGSNDVLVVKGEEREHLIPYIPEDYILEVNLEAGVMRVSWDPEF
jgi:16S rRNA processing protein RimM